MRRIFLTLTLLPGIALASPLATVNGGTINETMVQTVNPAATSNPEAQKQTLQILISRMILAQQTEQQGWSDTPAVQASLQIQKLDTLSNIAAQHYWKQHPISSQQIKSAYQKLLATLPPKEYRFRDIIVSDRQTAESILKELQRGNSFSQIAAKQSLAGNAALGGESGWIASTQVPAAFIQVLKRGKANEVFGPVPLPQGWGIIQKLGERSPTKPALNQVQPQLENQIRNQQLEAYVQQLRKTAKIHLARE
jgi:peptidyl-prolyl cis-trans isomerase C